MPRAEEEGEEMLQAMPENRPRQNPGSRFSRISVTTDKPQCHASSPMPIP